jgi:hypothetical protein
MRFECKACMGDKRQRNTLLVAVLMLCLGIFTVATGHMSWYGVQEVSGNQARAVGLLLIMFSVGLFFSYLRQPRGK